MQTRRHPLHPRAPASGQAEAGTWPEITALLGVVHFTALLPLYCLSKEPFLNESLARKSSLTSQADDLGNSETGVDIQPKKYFDSLFFLSLSLF